MISNAKMSAVNIQKKKKALRIHSISLLKIAKISLLLGTEKKKKMVLSNTAKWLNVISAES